MIVTHDTPPAGLRTQNIFMDMYARMYEHLRSHILFIREHLVIP